VAPAGQQRRPTAIEQVIGFSVQHLLSLTPDTLYETTPKWHGLLMIKLAASMAVPGLNIEQIERRTSVSFSIRPAVFLAGGWADT
jgi:hypothetical protein